MKLPSEVEALITKGYARKIVTYDSDSYRNRLFHRKWRNLLGEAKYDIPEALWRYTDWSVPPIWYEAGKLYQIKSHDFVIQIPNLLPLSVCYREYQGGNDWYFHAYTIVPPVGPILTTKKQDDFEYFLSLCYELVFPHRHPVKIEELRFRNLADGAAQAGLTRVYDEEYYGYGYGWGG
jgi:hypothetical protein